MTLAAGQIISRAPRRDIGFSPWTPRPVTASPSTSPLILAYFARREEMRRFLSVKAGRDADIEDLMQDLYLKVQRVDGVAIENPTAFLYRLASNLLLDYVRARRRSAMRDAAWRDLNHASFGAADIVDAADAEAAVAARLRLERLTRAIAALPPKTRQVFTLHKLDGLTHAETARRLGISRSAVEKHIAKAIKHLLKQENG